MHKKLKIAFENEIESAKKFMAKYEYASAFNHLERAHILGQSYVIPHTRTHILMLIVGIKTRNIKEIWGQLIRIPAGIIGSTVGILPHGNTGGANVSALLKMEIPNDLKELLDLDKN